MLGKGMTVSDATHRWVSEFSKFPQDMIQKLMSVDIDSWHEVTKPSVGRRVYAFNLPEEKPDGTPYDGTENFGEVSECVNEDTYIVQLDDGESIMVKEDDVELDEDSSLPMWGWLWQFGDSADDYWLEEMGGIQIMSDCGFRIYQNEEWGYFFGIDGCGYDFYEAHWLPLYRKRGLQWHDPDTELTEEEISGRNEVI